MNGFKEHDCLVNSDIWPYGNWEPNFMQQEQSEQCVSKDFMIDPSAFTRHSKIASKMEIRRTKDRIRKRIVRAKETPLASAVRREKNRRRMAAARARKTMQKKIFQCVQENTIDPEVIADANRLNRMTFGPPEIVSDPLPQLNTVFHRDKQPKEYAPVNQLLVHEMQPQSENLAFSHVTGLQPVELQVGKTNPKKSQTSEIVPILLDDDSKRADCGTIGKTTLYQPLLGAATFYKKNRRVQSRKQASPNAQTLDESISANGNIKQTMLSEIQMLEKNSANLTVIDPTIRKGKNKMATNCIPLEVGITSKSSNKDNIHVYQSPDIQTQASSQSFETPLNQLKRGMIENSEKTDQVSDKNANSISTSGMVTIITPPEDTNTMSIRYRRNVLISLEMRRKRDRLRKQLARARESQLEKEIRREKNRRRMAEFRARHRLKYQKTHVETGYEAVAEASWNEMWEQQEWTLNEVTPTEEQNNTSNLTHPPGTSSVPLLPKERRTFVVPNHLESFMSNLSSLWKAGRLCDASISNGTADIMIHKMVLATVCPKILTELSKTPLDKFQKVTFPSTVSKEALTAFAEYMYSGVLDLDETILAHLKIIAQRLDMKDFEQLCDSHLHTPQLVTTRTGTVVSNELEPATDFESAVGLRTQVTFRDDMTPVMKLVPVEGHNSDTWSNPVSDISFPIANATPNDGMLKIKQELADSATNENSSKPLVKKEPVSLEDKVLRDSSAWEALDLLRDQSTQPQVSLPHVESLVSISPLCAKIRNSDPTTASLNFPSSTTVGSSRPSLPNINLHGNASSSSSSSSSFSSSSSTSSTSASTSYSQTDNSQVNLLGSYATRTSETEAALTTAEAAIASLTSNTDGSTSQTRPIKLPSPLSFYNIT